MPMRSVEDLQDEITRLRGTASFYKWMAIFFGCSGVGLGISMLSANVLLALWLAAMFWVALWSGDASKVQRMEQEIRERSWD